LRATGPDRPAREGATSLDWHAPILAGTPIQLHALTLLACLFSQKGNGLVDPADGTFRDLLVEVCWSSFPNIEQQGQASYRAAVLFPHDYTAELLLLRGSLGSINLEGRVELFKDHLKDEGGGEPHDILDRSVPVARTPHRSEPASDALPHSGLRRFFKTVHLNENP
jgi:hypothetical protein